MMTICKYFHDNMTTFIAQCVVSFGTTDSRKRRPVARKKESEMKKHLNRISAVIGLALIASSSAFAGGVDTGGGNLVVANGKTGLLDLFVEAPTLFEDQEAGVKIRQSRAMKAVGIDRIDTEALGIASSLSQRIDRLAASSPVLHSYLRKAVQNLPIYVANSRIAPLEPSFSIPAEKRAQTESIRTAAVYIGGYGVFLSKKDFESLSRVNQEALVLHEALRHIQLTYRLGLTTENIQKITAKVMSGVRADEILDTEEYLSGRILNQVTGPKKTVADVNKIMEKAHKLLPEEISPCHFSVGDLNAGRISSLADSVREAMIRVAEIDVDRALEASDLITHLRIITSGLLVDEILHLSSNTADASVSLRKAMSAFDVALKDINENGWWMSDYRLEMQEMMRELQATGFFAE